MTTSLNTPKLSTPQYLDQITIGDEWLTKHKPNSDKQTTLPSPKPLRKPKKGVLKSPKKDFKNSAKTAFRDEKRVELIKKAKSKLLKLMKDEFIRKKVVAGVLGVSVTTLDNWTKQCNFPKSYYVKTVVRPQGHYKNCELLEFLNKY
ncbi:helix-turn-helix transcriptional regulator [Faucicola boevrei]|uniref:helix-turn-helix transcriptional regulator n=1 Tax=Faucicola boevrei TaxID=346665 RepID=UPI00036DE67E|nr:hypothetical protein [Moraxella boevrei]